MPSVRELTTTGEEPPLLDCVAPPSLEMHATLYAVIVLPPLPFGETATLAESLPRVTLEIEGAGAVVPATNELDAADAALAPTELFATTVQV